MEDRKYPFTCTVVAARESRRAWHQDVLPVCTVDLPHVTERSMACAPAGAVKAFQCFVDRWHRWKEKEEVPPPTTLGVAQSPIEA